MAGILGRKRAPKSTGPSPDGQALLQRQLASPDPVLRRLAEEVSGCQNAASGTVVPFPAKRPIKSRRTAGVPSPTFPHQSCRYCGRPGAPICERCEKIRSGFDTAQMSRHSIADRRGWVGPRTIGDDELLVTISRRLRDADQRRLADDEKDEKKARRAAQTAKAEAA
jgi:hypothetical protein